MTIQKMEKKNILNKQMILHKKLIKKKKWIQRLFVLDASSVEIASAICRDC